MTHAPRKTPCSSCPYRKNVPSGVWHPDEYAKLPGYDGETWEQNPNLFLCHQGAGQADMSEADLCSGWLGHRDPYDLLAVRLGLSTGSLTDECAEYTTKVPLFATGAEAAAHGLREVEEPGDRAQKAMDKLIDLKDLNS